MIPLRFSSALLPERRTVGNCAGFHPAAPPEGRQVRSRTDMRLSGACGVRAPVPFNKGRLRWKPSWPIGPDLRRRRPGVCVRLQ
jgi:hypothetical protein